MSDKDKIEFLTAECDLPPHLQAIAAAQRHQANLATIAAPRTAVRTVNRWIGARKANRHGANFQRAIMASQEDAEGLVVALIGWPPSGAKFVGKGRAVAQKIAFDFSGTVARCGRHICFDAKSCAGTGINLGDPEIVKPHQALEIYRQYKAGAIAGLLVEAVNPGRYLWWHARHMAPGECRYVGFSDSRWIPAGAITGRVDFRGMIELIRGGR